VWLHGGGWVLDGIDSIDAMCRILAQSAAATVVSVDHRVAPEHQFPVPLDDCWDAPSITRRCAASASRCTTRVRGFCDVAALARNARSAPHRAAAGSTASNSAPKRSTIMSRPLRSAMTSDATMPSTPGNCPAPPSGPSGTAIAAGKSA
jgi:hypothetical protein